MAMADRGERFTLGERMAATGRGARNRVGARVRDAGERAVGVGRALRPAGLVVLGLLVAAALIVAVAWQPVATPLAPRLAALRGDLLLLLQVVALFLAAAVLMAVVWWLFRAESGVAGPITDATGAELTAVRDLLVGHLDHIAAVQRAPVADIPGERLRTDPIAARPETLDSTLANVGSISVGGQATISIGQVLLWVKRLLPGGRSTAITGSVQRYGSSVRMVATVRWRDHTDTVMAEARTRSPQQADEVVPTIVREIAYRIHFALSGNRMVAGTWQLLEAFTEARAAYIQYLGSGREADREHALRLTRQTFEMDGTYVRLFGLFYALGTSYFGAGEFDRAIEQFQTALTIHPRQPQVFVQLARCRFAMEDDGEALKLLERVGGKPPDGHPMARYLHGMITGAGGDRRSAIEELMTVDHRPRSLRSAALVTIAGLQMQDRKERACRRALDRVAEPDFADDCYSRACWLSVRSALGGQSGRQEKDRQAALESLGTALSKRLIPMDYARRDPDLHPIRDGRTFPGLVLPGCTASG